MPLILPHHVRIQRHSSVPYLWRILCTCRWSAIAPDQEKAKLAATAHVEEEEAFPDYSFLADDPFKKRS